MRTSTLCGGVLLVAAALAAAPPASADANWKTSSAVWKSMDKCSQAALKNFPDYTAESNAKREAARLRCLRGGNLPGEAGPAPAPAPAGDAPAPQQ